MQKIIIADSHAVCRAALENFIRYGEEGIQVETAGDYSSLLDLLSVGDADLILLEHDLPGLPAAPEDMDFRDGYGGAKIAIMTKGFETPPKEPDLPGMDIFPKSLGSKQFLEGIKNVLSGQRFSPSEPMIHSAFEEEYDRRDRSMANIKLTQRERQVLSYLVTGAVNKDIARALDLQVVTVKLHVRGICRKMGVKNRTQAALSAREFGWI